MDVLKLNTTTIIATKTSNNDKLQQLKSTKISQLSPSSLLTPAYKQSQSSKLDTIVKSDSSTTSLLKQKVRNTTQNLPLTYVYFNTCFKLNIKIKTLFFLFKTYD